ncbi:MAG: YgaP-like transmembrane domain [Sphingomicrobium sp.]
MEKNVGSGDRIVRIIIAIVLGCLIYLGQITGTAATIVGVIAVLLLLSALLSRCLIYKIAGIDTTMKESSYSTTDDRAGL